MRVRVTFDEQGREDAPVFVISKAAELADMHPQTLRQFDRLGLVVPQRTAGRGRRYSQRDVNQLIEIQRLSLDEGINLAGIKRILDLESKVRALEARIELQSAQINPGSRIFAAGTEGEVVSVRKFMTARANRNLAAAMADHPSRGSGQAGHAQNGHAQTGHSQNGYGQAAREAARRRVGQPLQLTATVEDLDDLVFEDGHYLSRQTGRAIIVWTPDE